VEIGIGVFLVWAVAGAIWTRVYFRRRCGFTFQSGLWGFLPPGQFMAVLVGLLWPVTIFLKWRPEPCRHRSHVLERERLRERYAAEDAQIEAALRRQAGGR